MTGDSRSGTLFDDVDRRSDEAAPATRQRWRQLVGDVLPRAAREHPEWPVTRDHCFARIVLDHVCARPWREAVAAPAWKHLDSETLRQAIAVAEAIVDGSMKLEALNEASLAMRGKAGRRADRS